jgi:hypothetical protein
MFNRFLKKNDQPKGKTTAESDQKSQLDELSKNSNVLSDDKMNQIGGGFSSNGSFSDRYDWNSSLGGNTPL